VCDGAPDGKATFMVLALFFMFNYCFPDILQCFWSCFMPFYFAVTGLHDMDEFVQSQLILAVNYVSFYSFQCEKYVIDPNL
jgi:hypothetical protein